MSILLAQGDSEYLDKEVRPANRRVPAHAENDTIESEADVRRMSTILNRSHAMKFASVVRETTKTRSHERRKALTTRMLQNRRCKLEFRRCLLHVFFDHSKKYNGLSAWRLLKSEKAAHTSGRPAAVLRLVVGIWIGNARQRTGRQYPRART